jgi:diketogulonate reductase-like aldo/keto reductase
MSDNISSRVTLRGGVQVSQDGLSETNGKAPRYVFGTGGIAGHEPIHAALDVGYLAFDTAQQYGNEKLVGDAIRSYSKPIDRADLFIISKVNKPGASVEEAYEGIKQSVDQIGMDYVDLFLVHNPSYGPEGRRLQWLALERAKKEGLVRAIGVSN